jgi:hypothetical protein
MDEALTQDSPPYSSWISPRDQQVRVTVDMAHEEPMHQLVKEVDYIDSKLSGKFGSRQPHFDELLDEFFGESSDI